MKLLNSIKAYFGYIGSIAKTNKDMYAFRVTSLKENLTYVLPHFDMYPLITQKKAYYLLFKEIALMMKKGEHPNFFNKEKKNEKIKKNFFSFS